MGLQDSVRAGQSAAVRQQVVQAKRQATGFGMTNTKSVEDLKVAGEKLEQSVRADGGAAPGTPENTPNMSAFPEKADVEQTEDDPLGYLVNIVDMVQKKPDKKATGKRKTVGQDAASPLRRARDDDVQAAVRASPKKPAAAGRSAGRSAAEKSRARRAGAGKPSKQEELSVQNTEYGRAHT